MTTDYGDSEPVLVPGTLRGYRRWLPGGPVATLFSAFVRAAGWTPGLNVARCHRATVTESLLAKRCLQSPQATCACGLYAHYKPRRAGGVGVEGVVEASGRIILGTKGFRAEKARVVALCPGVSLESAFGAGCNSRWIHDGVEYLPRSRWHELAYNYGVEFFDNKEEMLLKYPPQEVSHLLPEKPPVTVVNEALAVLWAVALSNTKQGDPK